MRVYIETTLPVKDYKNVLAAFYLTTQELMMYPIVVFIVCDGPLGC